MIYWSIAAAAFAVTLAAAFFCGLVTTPYKIDITSRELPVGFSLRVVHLSDLHSTRFGKMQKKLIDDILTAMPDIVVMSGDMVDDRRDPAPAYELFEALKKHGIPMFFSAGNHEYYNACRDEIFSELTRRGAFVLDRNFVSFKIEGTEIAVAGIPDPTFFTSLEEWESEIFKLSNKLPKNSLKLLVSHRPEKLEYYQKAGFDIVFSGHAHGGQVRVPFIPGLKNGLYAPHQGLFPRYGGGLYTLENTVMSVSRGLSFFPKLPRIFNPPEIVSLTIESPSYSSSLNIPHKS